MAPQAAQTSLPQAGQQMVRITPRQHWGQYVSDLRADSAVGLLGKWSSGAQQSPQRRGGVFCAALVILSLCCSIRVSQRLQRLLTRTLLLILRCVATTEYGTAGPRAAPLTPRAIRVPVAMAAKERAF